MFSIWIPARETSMGKWLANSGVGYYVTPWANMNVARFATMDEAKAMLDCIPQADRNLDYARAYVTHSPRAAA